MRKRLIFLTLVLVFMSVFPVMARDNPFGVLAFLPWNDYWNNYMYPNAREVDRAVELIKELGVSTVRIDFSWKDIERTRGVYELERLDHIVSACQKHGLSVLGVIGYSPQWTGRQWNQPPSDNESLLKFVNFIVSRYKSVNYWEFWNEPDSPTYWQPQDEMHAYTNLLKAVYPVIKAANPDSRVVLGGLTSEGFYPLKNILREGGGNYFDVVNFHPFANPSKEDSLQEVGYKIKHIREELDKNGLKKPIWLTEIGCPGVRNVDGCSWWMGSCQDQRQQAQFLERAYTFLLNQQGVEKIFWAFFQDTDNHFHDGVDYFGLLRADYSKKPAYFQYQEVIRKFIRETR